MALGEPGSQYLKEIATVWQAEPSDVRWLDDGFEWRPGSHLVRVQALPLIYETEEAGRDRWRITVETEVLNEPPISSGHFINELAAMMRFITSTYSLVYPPYGIWKEHLIAHSPTLSMFSSVYVNPDTGGWLPRFFAQVALMQPINAEIQAQHLATDFGGQPAFGPSGKNSTPDEILEVAHLVYVPEGRKPSRWGDTNEFVEFTAQFARSDNCFGTGDRSGMTLETPFGSDSALIRLQSDQGHPQLGHGLLLTLQLPFSFEKDVARPEAAFLNYWEAKAWTNFPQLGCWHTAETGDGHERLAHTSFVPNALYSPGLATNLALWSLSRARWAREQRWPDLQDQRMIDVLERRFGR